MKGTVAGLFDGHFTHDHILGMVTITERDNFDLLNYKKKLSQKLFQRINMKIVCPCF